MSCTLARTCRRLRLRRILLAAGVAMLMAGPGCAVKWDLDYDAGAARAKQLNKPMLLYFKDWKSAEHRETVVQVFENPTVARELAGTVNVELLYNWGPAAQRYRTLQSPGTFIFCRPDGTEIERMSIGDTAFSPPQFAEWIRKVKAAYYATVTPPTGQPPAAAVVPAAAETPPTTQEVVIETFDVP